jgi:hypothetical protein
VTTSSSTTESEALPQKAEPVSEKESAPIPIPVLAPYVGLVTAVLCTLCGGWLLLAPYALDFRHGAKHLPRVATVDLETGAAVIAVGIVAAVLFSVNLALRLRNDDPRVVPVVAARKPDVPPDVPEEDVTRLEGSHEPDPGGDPGGALRELLTPLVAALAADLRSHDQEHSQNTQRKGP